MEMNWLANRRPVITSHTDSFGKHEYFCPRFSFRGIGPLVLEKELLVEETLHVIYPLTSTLAS